MSMSEVSKQCYTILPVVPIILNFIRQEKLSADAIIVKNNPFASTEADEEVLKAIASLSIRMEEEDRMSVTQIKYVLSDSEPQVWAQAIALVMGNCEPDLLSNETIQKLLATFQQHKQDIITKDESCGGLLGPIFDDIPRTHFEVLAGFVAFIRDYSKDLVGVCGKLSKGMLRTGGKDSKELFQVIVEKAEAIFGRLAVSRAGNASR